MLGTGKGGRSWGNGKTRGDLFPYLSETYILPPTPIFSFWSRSKIFTSQNLMRLNQKGRTWGCMRKKLTSGNVPSVRAPAREAAALGWVQSLEPKQHQVLQTFLWCELLCLICLGFGVRGLEGFILQFYYYFLFYLKSFTLSESQHLQLKSQFGGGGWRYNLLLGGCEGQMGL